MKDLEKMVVKNLETELNREIIGIGCWAHTYRIISSVLSTLPVDTACTAMTVYKYLFSIHVVTVEELKNFCDFARNNYALIVRTWKYKIFVSESINTKF